MPEVVYPSPKIPVSDKIKHLITDDPDILYQMFFASEENFKETFAGEEERKYPELAVAIEEAVDHLDHLLLWQQREMNILRDHGLEIVRVKK